MKYVLEYIVVVIACGFAIFGLLWSIFYQIDNIAFLLLGIGGVGLLNNRELIFSWINSTMASHKTYVESILDIEESDH